MKKVLSAVIALAFTVPLFAASWAVPTAKVQQSIVKLTFLAYDPDSNQTFNASCTGEVIDNERDFVLTAAHCLGENMKADGLAARAVWFDKEDDIAVLVVPGVDKPALVPSTVALQLGDEVATVGYGYGLDMPLFRHGWVSQVAFEAEGLVGSYLSTDNGYIGGMSGGPVFDFDGNMVGIVQMANGETGLGKDIKFILKRTGKFWSK